MLTIKYTGNLGNKLFELWSAAGIGKNQNFKVHCQTDELFNYFNGPFTFLSVTPTVHINEPAFQYQPVDLSSFNAETDVVELKGYYQSEKYWLHLEKSLRKAFTFKHDFLFSTTAKLPGLFDKEVICVSIRRGDFVRNKVYYQLTPMYYIGALLTEFPGFEEKYNLLFISDDMAYCHAHFDCLPNAFFADGLTPMEQLCLGSLADYHVISNSTFSWWAAYLSKSKKVIRPKHNFGEAYRQANPETDFWPETKDWKVFDHEGYKIPMKDTTFMIPVFMDHQDRKQNLDLSVCMLQRDFDTNVFVMENRYQRFEYMKQWCRYEHVNYMYFHRTKMLNVMAVKSETPLLFNWDADVIVPPMQVYLCVKSLRDGVDFSYPYDGRFVRVLRKPYFSILSTGLDIGELQNACEFQNGARMGKPMAVSSVGGAVGMRKDMFITSGMENEKMVSYAPEDCERWDRWHMLGYQVIRIPGKLYHVDHWCGQDSLSLNPFFEKNHAELDKIRAMSVDELADYVRGWEWRQTAQAAISG